MQRSVKEHEVAVIALNSEQAESIDGQSYVKYKLGPSAQAWFANGHLILFSYYRDDPFEIANSSNGEYVKLPLSKRDMIRVFGRPKRYTYSRQKLV